MTKKIGIATIHHTTNPGSVLQAYSQATSFQRRFQDYDVEIINYRFKSQQLKLLRSLLINLAKLKFKSFKERSIYKSFIKNNLPLSQDSLISDDYNKAIKFINDKYDMVVVGSDELWKTISPKFTRPFPNIYWLGFRINSKKIGFAVSANRCEFKDISLENRDMGRRLLEDFDYIGVRDDHTKEIINSIGVKNKRINKIPDPTFNYEFRKAKKSKLREKLNKLGIDFSKPILGVYSAISSSKKGVSSKSIVNQFKRNEYQIVSLKGKCKHCDLSLKGRLNPFEWAEVYSYFDFCLTSTFHGTIFSIKNRIPFLSIEHQEYYSRIKGKIRDLLEDMSLMDHYCYLPDVENKKELMSIINRARENFDVSKVDKEIDKMKKSYKKGLKQVQKII